MLSNFRLADLVANQRVATKENVQRKQARTDGEREDSDAEESEEDSPDEADDDVPYNPKNLPLGWDGKVCFYHFCCFHFYVKNLYKMFATCSRFHIGYTNYMV